MSKDRPVTPGIIRWPQDDLAQDWEDENFYLMYGNLNGKLEFNEHGKIETNVFARYSKSDLYQPRPAPFPKYAAPLIFTYPNKLVARDMFKLQHDKYGDDYREELVLNKFFTKEILRATVSRWDVCISTTDKVKSLTSTLSISPQA